MGHNVICSIVHPGMTVKLTITCIVLLTYCSYGGISEVCLAGYFETCIIAYRSYHVIQ